MTPLERQVARYVRRWVPRMGLHQWDIGITLVDSLPNDALMEVAPDTAYLRSPLRVRRSIRPGDCPNNSIEYCVVHELTHLLLDPLADAAFGLVDAIAHLSPPAESVCVHTLRTANEQTTEAVARLLWQQYERR